MPSGAINEVVRRLRGAAAADGGDATDAQLLGRFVARRDEAAFAALVRRHGPMVLGVCRRVVGCAHDADDAFQATFLVLARKAASVGRREQLGNWLYGVAYRTARKARAAAVRRRGREKQVTDMPQPAVEAEDSWRELLPLLDHELNRLPDKYRTPVVLCDLQGRTRKEVARRLGVPEGTLSSRLATARRLLAARLTRRGLALSGGALAVALSQEASASVPAVLTAHTARAAALFAAGSAGGLASAPAVALAEGVVKTMLMTKLKVAAFVVLAAALAAGVGAKALGPGAVRAADPDKGDAPKAAPDDKKAKDAADAEFLRRACLDVRGTPPTPLEVQLFLADKDPEKRAKLIDRLLADPERLRQRIDDLIRRAEQRRERAQQRSMLLSERLDKLKDGKLTPEDLRRLEATLDALEEEDKGEKKEPQPAKDELHEVKRPADSADKDDVRTLDFRFKDVRPYAVEVPGEGGKRVWCLPYEVVNATGKEHTFVPDFELETRSWSGASRDAKGNPHHDRVLPAEARAFLEQALDTSGAAPAALLKTSASIAADPIPPAKAGEAPRGVAGLATWDDVEGDGSALTVYVGGLTNARAVATDAGKSPAMRKVLRLDFKKADGAWGWRFAPPATWEYRADRSVPPGNGVKAEGPPADKDAALAQKDREIADLKDRLTQAQVEAQQLAKRNKELEQRIQELEKERGKKSDKPGDVRPADGPPVEGVVTKVADGLVIVNLGADAGLQKGQTLEVFRLGDKGDQAKYLGRIRIVEVKPTESVGQPMGKPTAPIEVGDHAATRVIDK
jgi:RNA polymerase sigma factor (sigma-70 family)